MTLVETIDADYKTAMKEKDTVKLETLRAIRNEWLIMKKKDGVEPTDSARIAKLNKMLTTRMETAEVYKKAGRIDLHSKELQEAAVIVLYVPQDKMSELDVITLTLKVAKDNSLTFIKANMGKIVKLVVAEANGTTDGKTVSAVVNNLIQAGNVEV